MKATKTNLNKIIKWTSSKFNEYCKSEIIDIALRLKPSQTFICRCGSYAEGAYNGGNIYRFMRTENTLVIYSENDAVFPVVLEVNQ